MNTNLALVLLLATPALQATCPPLPTATEFARQAQADEDWLPRYAFARTLKCGWDEALPAIERAMQARRGQGEDDEFREGAMAVAIMHPQDLVVAYAEESDEAEQDPWLRPLRLRPDEYDSAVRHVEQAIPRLFAVLADTAVGETNLDSYLQVALIAHEVRSGEMAAARARLERVSAAYVGRPVADDDDIVEVLQRTRAALAPVSPVESTATDWVLDRSGTTRRGSCGLEQLGSGIDPAGLRAQMLRAQGDTAGAIAVLLRNEWRGPDHSGVSHALRLLPLLRERYPGRLLQQGWLDAEGSIRTQGEHPGFLLYGVELPLPDAVRETDPADPARTTERPLRHDEALAYLREWQFVRILFPNGVPAR